MQTRVPDQDVSSGWGCRSGTYWGLGMQTGVSQQEALEEYTSGRGCRPALHLRFLLLGTMDVWPRVALRDDLAGVPISGPQDTPQHDLRPTTVLRGMGDGVEKY